MVPCAIAGWRALREAVAATGADVVVALRGGVIAFGRDEEVRRALAGHEPGPLDLHPIEARRLEYESSELGLLYEAIAPALTRGRPLRPRRRRGLHFVTVDPDADHAALAPVRAATGQLAATVPGTAVCWAEAVEVSLTFRLGRLWLIIEPRVWLDPPPDDRSRFAAQEFVRQRTAPRYNPVANRLLEAWRQVLLGPGEVAELRAFGIEDGVDATFHVRTTSAFSWRRAR